MDQDYYTDRTFDRQDYTSTPLPAVEYEQCTFQNCDFSGSSLINAVFIDCVFSGCNMSLTTIKGTAFRGVKFQDCKLLGLRFDECNSFNLSFTFERCTLNNTSFFGLKIKKTVFSHCQIREADFTNAELTASFFTHCDLLNTTFGNTILEQADFRTAEHYLIDPERNKIKKAKFTLPGVLGLLAKYNIQIT